MEEDKDGEMFMDVLEEMIGSCLAVLRRERRRIGRRCAGQKRLTQIAAVCDALGKAGRPMHVDAIVSVVARDYGINLRRDSIVSSISKKTREGVIRKTGPNEFELVSH